MARGAAKGVGNPVFYVGPATGRDGLAGAAFASQDLTGESAEQQRGAAQVGDPFMEKLCMEACSSCWPPARSQAFRTWAQPA